MGDESGCCPEHIEGKYLTYCTIDDITKHSKNIIDLIEAEDCLIYKIKGSNHIKKEFVEEHIDARSNKKYLSMGFYSLEQLEILEIITKEQIEEIDKYKVKEE